MTVIGLTGGMATGKSTVADMLRELGAAVIDADQIAHSLLQPTTPVWEHLVREFGPDILEPDDTINRQRLARAAFSSPERVQLLNSITHPPIMEEIGREVERLSGDGAVTVIDAPLLLEVNMTDAVDEVWVVGVDRETQLKRLFRREPTVFSQHARRISSQMPLQEKARLADVVIDNTGTIDDTRRQVWRQWQRLKRGESPPTDGPEGG